MSLSRFFLYNLNLSDGSIVASHNSNTIGSLITTAGNIGIGTTAPQFNLDVSGNIRSTELLTTNLNVTNFTASNFLANTINYGINSIFSGSFSASNNVLVPENITGFNFVNSDIRSFQASVTISVLRSSGGNLYQSYIFDGFQTDAGWSLYTSNIGNDTGLAFSITPEGQIQYTSTNITNFISNTIRFSVSQISNTGTYAFNSNLTGGTLLLDSIQILNTQNSIIGTNPGSLHVLGGSTFQQGINILTTENTMGLGTGGGLSIFGGTSISKDLLVGGNISSSTLNSTNISASNINLSNNLNVAGTLTVVNITSTNLMDTNLTAGIARITTNLVATGNSNTIGNIFTTNGNIGIGTSAPSSLLHIVGGGIRLNSGLTNSFSRPNLQTSVGAFEIRSSSVNGDSLDDGFLRLSAGGGTNVLTQSAIELTGFSVVNDMSSNIRFLTSGTERIRITSSGNVGIGTTAPNTNLNIIGSSSSILSIGRNSQTNDTSLTLGTSTLQNGYTYIQGLGRSNIDYGNLILNPDGGNIGISTNTPGVKLAVRGRVEIGTSVFDYSDYGALNVTLNDADIAARSHIALIRSTQSIGYIRVNTSNQFVITMSGGGVFLANGGTSWSAVSDKNLKTSFKDIQNPLDKLCQIKGTYYHLISDQTKKQRVGVIAQDVQQVLPEAVTQDNDGILGVSYTELIPLLIEAIKELKQEFEIYKQTHP